MPPRNSLPAVLAALFCTIGLVIGVCVLGIAGAADSNSDVFSGRAICRTDSAGYCTVNHGFGRTPASAQLTPVYYPGTRPFFMALASSGSSATQLRVRAMFGTTSPVNVAEIEFSYTLFAATAPPPTSTTAPSSTTTTTQPPVTTTTTVPTTTTAPPVGGFPNASNTGTPAGTVFTNTVGDYEARTDNAVLDKVHITGSVSVYARNVRITNSLIDDTVLIVGAGSVVITDTTIGPPEVAGQPCPAAWNSGVSTTSTAGSYTLLRVHIRGHEDGLKAGGTNMRVEDSYINACGDASDHSDGIQDYEYATGLVLNHNTFDDRGPAQNGAVYINAGDKGGTVSTDVTITNNLGLGGAYVFYLWPGNGSWTVTGNRAVLDPPSFGAYNTGGRCSRLAQWADNDIVTVNSAYGIASTVQNDIPCP